MTFVFIIQIDSLRGKPTKFCKVALGSNIQSDFFTDHFKIQMHLMFYEKCEIYPIHSKTGSLRYTELYKS